MRKIVFTVLFVLGYLLSIAQQRPITGKISDEKGEPVPGATVTVKGTNKSVIAEANGQFSITANKGDVLVISAVGIQGQEVTVGDDFYLTITMNRENLEMSEVVVTALGIRREKRALGFAVQEVKGEQLTVAKSIDVSSSLAKSMPLPRRHRVA
jgi:hypothetical protein